MSLKYKEIQQEVLIRMWFKQRFKRMPEQDIIYFEEWLNRFSKGEQYALLCMDNESLKCWKEIKAI